MANVLITGASGYLGGSFLNDIQATKKELPHHGTIYALVRTDEQARQVEQLYGAAAMHLDLSDQDEITKELLEKKISIVFFLIDARGLETLLKFIKALTAVQKQHGIQTHLIQTTGAKMFSGFTGLPTNREFSDADEGLFDMLKNAKAPVPFAQEVMLPHEACCLC